MKTKEGNEYDSIVTTDPDNDVDIRKTSQNGKSQEFEYIDRKAVSVKALACRC